MHSSSLDGAVDQARLCRAPEREIENIFVGQLRVQLSCFEPKGVVGQKRKPQYVPQRRPEGAVSAILSTLARRQHSILLPLVREAKL